MKKLLYSLFLSVSLVIPGITFTGEHATDLSSAQAQSSILVPFNSVLFTQYCTAELRKIDNQFLINPQLAMKGFFSCNSLLSGINGLWKSGARLHKAYNAWTWFYNKTEEGMHCGILPSTAVLLWNCGGLAIGVTVAIPIMKVLLKVITEDGKVAKKEKWEMLILASYSEQETEWNAIIAQKFGKPIVTGTLVPGKAYKLAFEKVNGGGYVTFDPTNEKQIKILLGLDSVKENYRCNTLSIVTA